jgi:dUTP pyrophosphatase
MKYKRFAHLPQTDEPQLVRAHPYDAGADIRSNEEKLIKPKDSATITTGIAVEIPRGFVGLVWPRSGLAAKNGIETGAGVIDPDFSGELKIVVRNTSYEPFLVEKGMRIAQLVVVPVELGNWEEVEKFTVDEENEEVIRGASGFGSTGIL